MHNNIKRNIEQKIRRKYGADYFLDISMEEDGFVFFFCDACGLAVELTDLGLEFAHSMTSIPDKEYSQGEYLHDYYMAESLAFELKELGLISGIYYDVEALCKLQ